MLAFALRHEFRASSFAVVRLEDLKEIADLKADLIACYKPVNSQELVAIERIALAQQAIFRGYRLEAGLFTSAFNSAVDPEDGRPIIPMHPDTVGDGDMEITRTQNRNYALAEGFRRVAKESNALSLVMRYQQQAERQYRRAIEEFERLKKLRPELPNEPNLVQPEPPADIAPLSELNPSIQVEEASPTTVSARGKTQSETQSQTHTKGDTGASACANESEVAPTAISPASGSNRAHNQRAKTNGSRRSHQHNNLPAPVDP